MIRFNELTENQMDNLKKFYAAVVEQYSPSYALASNDVGISDDMLEELEALEMLMRDDTGGYWLTREGVNTIRTAYVYHIRSKSEPAHTADYYLSEMADTMSRLPLASDVPEDYVLLGIVNECTVEDREYNLTHFEVDALERIMIDGAEVFNPYDYWTVLECKALERQGLLAKSADGYSLTEDAIKICEEINS